MYAAAVGVVGGVVHDQGEADDDMSAKQRLILAAGSTISEVGGAVGDLTGNDIAADTLDVAGICKLGCTILEDSCHDYHFALV